MFTDDFCEDWDSTKNQDDFIKEYFNKRKVVSGKKSVDKFKNINIAANSLSEATKQNISSDLHLMNNKQSLNCEQESTKKRKKEKQPLHNPFQEYCSETHSYSRDIQVTESSESNNTKKKKKKKPLVNKNISNSIELSDQAKNAEDLNAKTVTGSCTSSTQDIDFHNEEVDSNYIKLKKNKKRSRDKSNNVAVETFSTTSEIETMSDVIINDSSVRNNNLLRSDSDCNSPKMKKRKKKFKDIETSSELNNFVDGKFNDFDGCNELSVKKSNLTEITSDTVLSNSDSKFLKKKKIKNIKNSLENNDFSHKAEPTNFEISHDLPVKKNNLLQNKAYQKLQAAKFRYLNEMLYTNSGKDALTYFQQNTDEFQEYHQGYQLQVSKWPINPVDIIIQELSQISKQAVIADLGCGEAKIAEVFPKRKVHSFDLIALKDCVTACDISNVPLPTNSVDVVVFCLSLMGTNWKDYLKEAQRILKFDGIMKIAEIESRIENLKHFIKEIENFGFSLIDQNLSHKMFVFLNFKRTNKNKKSSKVPAVTLKPCLYKKR